MTALNSDPRPLWVPLAVSAPWGSGHPVSAFRKFLQNLLLLEQQLHCTGCSFQTWGRTLTKVIEQSHQNICPQCRHLDLGKILKKKKQKFTFVKVIIRIYWYERNFVCQYVSGGTARPDITEGQSPPRWHYSVLEPLNSKTQEVTHTAVYYSALFSRTGWKLSSNNTNAWLHTWPQQLWLLSPHQALTAHTCGSSSSPRAPRSKGANTCFVVRATRARAALAGHEMPRAPSREGCSGDQPRPRCLHTVRGLPQRPAAGQLGAAGKLQDQLCSAWGADTAHSVLASANAGTGFLFQCNSHNYPLIRAVLAFPPSAVSAYRARSTVNTMLLAKIGIIFTTFTGNTCYTGCCLEK